MNCGKLDAATLDLGEGPTKRLDEVCKDPLDDYPFGLFGVLRPCRDIDSNEGALGELPA